jgi:hypothetical protein
MNYCYINTTGTIYSLRHSKLSRPYSIINHSGILPIRVVDVIVEFGGDHEGGNHEPMDGVERQRHVVIMIRNHAVDVDEAQNLQR